MKTIIVILVLAIGIRVAAQNDKKIGLTLECQFMQVTSSLNFKRVGLNGSLSADYKLSSKGYAGAYFLEMTDISRRADAVYVINGKIVDISTSSFTNFGLYGGYKIYSDDKFSIIPEFRLGYGLFKAKAAVPGLAASENLIANMLTFTPRAVASYQISGGFSAGLSVGYPLFIYTSDQKLDEYNMQNINIGTYLKVHLW
jgi:hypothetical protein